MREKAIEVIRKPIMAYHPQVGMTMVALDKGVAGDILDHLLTLICEEIEKSLLKDEEIWRVYGVDYTDGDIRAIAEEQVKNTLKILEEK